MTITEAGLLIGTQPIREACNADRGYATMFGLVALSLLGHCEDWPGEYASMRDTGVLNRAAGDRYSVDEDRRRADRTRDERLMAWLLMDWGCRGHASAFELVQWRNWARAFPLETKALALECGFDAFKVGEAKVQIKQQIAE